MFRLLAASSLLMLSTPSVFAYEFTNLIITSFREGPAPMLEEFGVLSMQEDAARLTLLPDLDQAELVVVPIDDTRFRMMGDGFGLDLRTEDFGATMVGSITNFTDGTSNTLAYSVATVRPFASLGINWQDVIGRQPALVGQADGSMSPAGFEIVDGTTGLLTATFVDPMTKRELSMVGTTSDDGRFMAAGIGKGVVVRMVGEVQTDDHGVPASLKARYTIESPDGRPIANGIIAILIGL